LERNCQVQERTVWEGSVVLGGSFSKQVTAYKAVAYNGPGVNFPVESKFTTNRAEAEDWAARASAGEKVPEAGFASYSDD
jgi:hypothetical protein